MATLVKFEDLLDAFEFVSAGQPMEHEAYLCIETGVIFYHSEFGDNEEPVPDDIDDAEKYLALPHKNDLDLGMRLALRFAEEYLVDVVDDVHQLFRHKGAYGRFKNLVERHRSRKEKLRHWCEDNEIEVQG